ncbi:hypothetical protein TIFTF001_025951 [Ficus carica]|uniref:RIN4 pathogenic type III effector avirulence factor Avr cleavage site domain-containing protein n=1 Tax=Ficus carica TaxID=3494 RepID=A0AA88DFY3_FICCA|nr:hypothetical protein TIFTF001_025951 [Ficus carica]
MASPDRGRPLPKFGEWDVNNPASAEGFTVIFNKARDEKKTKTAAVVKIATPRKNDVAVKKVHDNSKHTWNASEECDDDDDEHLGLKCL